MIVALRVFLVVLFGVLVFFQSVSLPGQFRSMAEEAPEGAHLRWPATVITIFWVLCVQVVLVAIWRLLTMVRKDSIFSDAAFVWVDAIVWAIGVGWASLVVVFLLVGFTATDPGVPLLLFLMLVGATVVGLIVVVMRALLRRATSLRSDMDSVI